jgi:NADH-quinone oxidoreductase subunit G
LRVLNMLAEALNVPLGLRNPAEAKIEFDSLGVWDGERSIAPSHEALARTEPAAGEAILTTWRMLLDLGSLQDGETNLAGTARKACVRLSGETALEIGVENGDQVRVSSDAGFISLPLEITKMPTRVVWLPENSEGSQVRRTLGVTSGAVVRIGGGS